MIKEINDLNSEEIIGTFHEKELQKTNQKEFRIQEQTKTKRNKLCVKWKGYDISFISWIDKKDLNQMSFLEETLMSKLIYLIMQQKLI